MRSDAEAMTPVDLENALQRRFRNEYFHIVLRCFTVGHSEKYLNRHCGQHTMIMRACIESPSFQQIATTCRRRADLQFKRGTPVIKVLCICSQGMHGSVGVANTLKHVYQQLGYNSIGPCNLSRNEWMRGMCDVCMHCRPNKEKDALISSVRQRYF